MKEKMAEYYFPVSKLIYMFSLIAYFIHMSGNVNYNRNILEVGLLFIFVAVNTFYELFEKKNIILISFSLIICGILIFSLGEVHYLLIPLVILDLIEYFQLSRYLYFLTFLGIVLISGNELVYIISCVSCNIIYFQHYYIIKGYKTNLSSFIDNESSLKTNIENQKVKYKDDMKKSSLAFENLFLEEKSRLSQALHDKIGHSINGSVYQLEASKLLIESKPEDSKNIVQAVIDNLRKSLDEIRAILRNEKPNKGQLALLQLRNLCENFNDNYNINAKLVCNGEIKMVPESSWQVILDNTIESFSNALKYSGCKTIKIDIVILNKLVRCSISDDGRGCNNIIEGMGLAGMKERTKAIHGNFSVRSEIGFEINMLLPIK